ncbi:MAG: pentapeptide repeat-containing protein [Cyanobacteria bacterium J06635_10]
MDELEEMLRLNALSEEIVKRYEAGERNLASVDLRKIHIYYTCFMEVDFSGASLQKSFFENIYLVNTNFSCANLERAGFSGYLISCDLSNTNLREVNFKGTNLTGVDLTGADLTSANLSGAKLIGTNLRNANLTGTKITESTIFCNTIMPDGRIENKSPKVIDAQELLKRYAKGERDFRNIFLDGVDLSGVNLQSINLCGAHLSHVNLQGAIFHGEDLSAHFIGCDMRDTQLICTDVDYKGKAPSLICSDLRRAHLERFEWCGATFIGSNFQGAEGISDASGEGFAFIHNTTWTGGTFVAGPTLGLHPFDFGDIDPSHF